MRAALALLLLAPLSSADVRIVSPTGPYTQIQDAVNAANDGDLVLVKSPQIPYLGFIVQAKSLTITAEANVLVGLSGPVSVLDLAPGQVVSLNRILAQGAPSGASSSHSGLFVSDCIGSVRCQGCNFYGASWGGTQLDGFDSVWIENSADVSLVACQLSGGGGAPAEWMPNPPSGGCGLRSQSSTLTIFDSVIDGGSGEESPIPGGQSGHGGIGMHASGCTIFISNTEVYGGGGGPGSSYWGGPDPGSGGLGVLLDSVSMMHVLACSFEGGSGGLGGSPGSSFDGYPYSGGTFDFLAGTRRTMTVAPNPVREQHSVSFTCHGAGLQQVYLLVGLETAVQWDPLRLSNFLIAPPQYRTLYLGMTNVFGNLTKSLHFGELGGTVQSQTYFLQPLFVGAGGAQQLGTPITLAALDQQF